MTATADPSESWKGVQSDLATEGAFEVAKSNWLLNTIVGNSVMHAAASADEESAPFDPSFNARRLARENPDVLAGLETELAQGAFDRAMNRQQFDNLVQVARWRQDLRQTIKDGHEGSGVLNFAYEMLDVTSILSAGSLVANSAKTLGGRALFGAATGAADAAIQEGGLQAMGAGSQTPTEAFLNIGIGTSLGAGLGVVFKHVPPNHPILKHTPENPLHPEHPGVPMVEQKLGSTVDDSIGAARVAEGVDDQGNRIIAPRLNEVDFEAPKVGGVAQRFLDFLSGMTPTQRAAHYEGPAAETFGRLVDPMGLMNNANTRGVATGATGEDLRTLYLQRGQIANNDLTDIFRQANADLGQSNGAISNAARDLAHTMTTGAVDVNRIHRQDFFDAVDRLNAALASKDPKASDNVREHLKGLLGDEGKADVVLKRVQTAVDRQQKFYKEFAEEGVRHGILDPDALQSHYVPTLYNKKGIDKDPAGFRTLLMQHVMEKPQEEWLRERGFINDPNRTLPEGAAPLPESWDAILKTDKAKAAEVMTEWAGDAELARGLKLQGSVESALRRQADAMDSAEDVLWYYRKAGQEYKKAGIKELKAEGRAIERGAHAKNLAAATNAAETAEAKVVRINSKIEDIEGFNTQLDADLQVGGQQLDAAGQELQAAKGAVSDADKLVEGLQVTRFEKRVERDSTKLALNQEGRLWSTRTKQQQAELDSLQMQRKEAQAEAEQARVYLREAEQHFDATAAQQANTREWKDAVVQDMNVLLKNGDEAALAPGYRERWNEELVRLDVLRKKLDEATEARKHAYEMKKAFRKELTAAEKDVGQASWHLRKQQWALNRDMQRTPAAVWADRLTNHLRGNERAPGGFLWDNPGTSGRLKAKEINWSPEEMEQLRASNFRENDPLHQLDRYSSDVGGAYAAHRSLNGQTWEQLAGDIQRFYDEKIAETADPKEVSKLQAIREDALKTNKGMLDRVMGKHELKDDDGISWVADRLRQGTFLRFGGGFIFGAMGDIATGLYAARGFNPLMQSMRRDTAKLVKEALAGNEGAGELRVLLASFEHGAHMAFSDRALASGAAEDLAGFGSGVTRKVTAKVEAGMNAVGDFSNKASGLKAFSDGMRRTAGLVQLANIAKWSKGGWDGLKPGVQADLTKIGIGKYELTHIGRYIEKHSETLANGLVVPNMRKWIANEAGDTDVLGSRMADALQVALVRTQKRASLVSGFGSQPLLMSKPVGRLVMQFASYGAQFYNAQIRSSIQHGAVTGEWQRTAMAIGMALAMGEVTATISAFRKGGEEEFEKLHNDPAFWSYQVIQRSGILGMAGSYVDAPIKLLAPTIKNLTGLDLAAGQGKFSANSAIANLAGPWAGTLETISQAAGAAATGDSETLRKKAQLLIPMNQQLSIMQRMAAVDSY
ncbi:hypothetical protein [Rhizobacter sp. Root1221]|uniref:hypothetical protein n=1 Tax=Rhizobacter sp. Root1221 TaxID=1736433 RepID=UPI0006FFA624|nr:hypothetical protein [Rhizobacter sp. Root1221]KQV99965.1 hypothetical protein ASC87_19890 [Rhizobacter sp. Root1221]